MRSDRESKKVLTSQEREEQELAEAIAASLESQAEGTRGHTPPNANQIGGFDQRGLQFSEPVMKAGADTLHAAYPGLRTIRGDGNCYYRAIMYGLLEQIIMAPNREVLCGELIHKFRVLRDKSSLGDSQKIDNLIIKLQLAQANELWPTVADFEADMRDPNSDTDAALVWSARLMCADATRTQDFVSGTFDNYPGTNEEEKKQAYLKSIVTYGEDAQDAAVDGNLLPIALGINSTKTYFGTSGSSKGKIVSIPGNDGAPLGLTVHLLLRPGHYDLLYSKEQVAQFYKHQVSDIRDGDSLDKKLKTFTKNFLTLLANPDSKISHINASRKLVMKTVEACDPEKGLSHLISLNDALTQQQEQAQSNQAWAKRIDVELIIVQAKIAELMEPPHP